MREDGSYQAIDFTLAELQQLSLFHHAPADLSPAPQITIATLAAALDLVRAMQYSLGRNIEIIGEIKKSWQYQHENRDISRAVLDICRQYGYTTADSGFTVALIRPGGTAANS